MRGFALLRRQCESMRRRRHLRANEMDVLLNLRNPLAEDSEQFRDGGTRVSEDLSALRLTGVKEGELCRRQEDGGDKSLL